MVQTTYRTSSASPIAKCQDEDSSNQTPNFVDSGDKALVYGVVLGLGEVGIERVCTDDTRHNSLIITEEEETSRGNC